MGKNLRVRLLAAATVNGKRSYYKPAMRSTGWPDPAAVLVRDRKVRISPNQLHAYLAHSRSGFHSAQPTNFLTCLHDEGHLSRRRVVSTILCNQPNPVTHD